MKKKKLLSAVLLSAMVLTLCPVSYAADGNPTVSSGDTVQQDSGDSPESPGLEESGGESLQPSPDSDNQENLPQQNPGQEQGSPPESFTSSQNPEQSESTSAPQSAEDVSGVETDAENLDALAWENQNVLADGIYAVGSWLSPRQVIDVDNGSHSNAANVQLFATNASEAQRWQVSHDSNGYVIITNTLSGKVLDVDNAKALSGTNVQQYSYNGTSAQKWIAVRNEDSTVTLYSALGNNLVLDAAGGYSTNRTNIQIFQHNGSAAQKFCFYPASVDTVPSGKTLEDGTYTVISGSLGLDVSDSTLQAQNPDSGRLSQSFYFTYQESSGYYTITSCSSGKLLDADKGDIVPGASVSTYGTEYGGYAMRLWSIVENTDGSYSIYNAANGQTLGLLSSTPGGAAVTVPSSSSRTCTWQIVPSELCWSEDEIDSLALSKVDSPDLAPGTYQISTALKVSMALEAAGGSQKTQAKVQLYSSNSTAAQRWTIDLLEDGYVRLVNAGSGLVMDISNGSLGTGAQIQQFSWNGTRAQKWLPIKNENGTYTFYSALGHGLVLDVDNAGTSNGTKLQSFTINHTDAQTFQLYNSSVNVESQGRVLPDGFYSISHAANTQMVLDLRNGDSGNGVPLQMFSSNGTLAQCFYLKYCSDGYYRIQIGQTGKTVDLSNGGLFPGTPVQQWSNNDSSKNQRWVLSPNEDGSFCIISAANGLCMDAGNATPSSAVTTRENSGSASQKWTFTEFVPKISEGCYTISSSINSGKVLDIADGSKASGGNAQIYSSNKTLAQKWQVRTLSDGSITLQNLGSGMYLSESGKNNVCQLDNSGSVPSAQWELKIQLGNGYVLVNKSSGRVLDLSNASTANGTNIGTHPENGTKAQAWSFASARIMEPGFYEFAPLTNTNLRLDVSNGSRNNNANVQVFSSNGTLSQRWWVQDAGNGWYTLTACCSAKLLDVQNSSTASGANVQQYQKNGYNAQKWRFEVGERGIILVSALGNVLDVSDGSAASGANVHVWERNSSNAQQWRIFSAATPSKIGWQNPAGYPQVSCHSVVLPSYCTGYFTYVTPSRIAIDATREQCVDAFIARAYEYIGTRYIEPWSSWPGDAVDCSGLVLQCLYATGMDLGVYNPYNHRWLSWQTYNSMNWYNNRTFMPVSVNNLMRGDLVYYRGHVAIYIGNGQIIDSWPGQGVSIRGLYSRGAVIGAARPFV